MTCIHKVRWSVKRPEDCRFRLSVSHYKDRIVAPEEYSGATVVTPSDSEQVLATKDKLVRDNITIEQANLGILNVDPLTMNDSSVTPTGETIGFSQVNVEEDWDEVLYPIPDDPDKVFNAKWVPVQNGDTIIIDGYGKGRFGTNGTNKIDVNTLSNSWTIGVLPSPNFTKFRLIFTVTTLANDAKVVLAGYQWTGDGTHSSNEVYQFRGDYIKYKVIHAST